MVSSNSRTKKNTAKKSTGSRTSRSSRVKQKPSARSSQNETQRVQHKEISGIILIAVAVLLICAFFAAPAGNTEDVSTIGIVSLALVKILRFVAGNGAAVFPFFLLLFGWFLCRDRAIPSASRLIGLLLILCAVLGWLNLKIELVSFAEYFKIGVGGAGGGIIGSLESFILLKTIGKSGAIIVYIALILIGLLLALQTTLSEMRKKSGKALHRFGEMATFASEPERRPQPLPEEDELNLFEPGTRVVDYETPVKGSKSQKIAAPAPVITEPAAVQNVLKPPKKTSFANTYMPDISGLDIASSGIDVQPAGISFDESGRRAVATDETSVIFSGFDNATEQDKYASNDIVVENNITSADENVVEEYQNEEELISPDPNDIEWKATEEEENTEEILQEPSTVSSETSNAYILPSPDLITAGLNVHNPRMNKNITDSIAVLENTLKSFGVKATVTRVVAGPSVTRYELQPAPGVKVSRITSLADDIALSLAAQGVRIEAPIPGKSAIGIEVARKERDTVYFREMIESAEFQKSNALLSFTLGKNIGGECIIGNLAKMPHLLIAGSTGSGKSVCINTIICSLLFKAKPNEVKLLLIDPKKVELTQYARLPHLVAPVVNDSKKAANALKWVVNEMDNRYTLFADCGVKHFEGYNALKPEDPMPHIVVIIDELADLMMVAKHDVEESVCRLAQLARAAGIHLVVATQRPSVDVITGLIKANIPSRIAFAVSSYTDSRTILDTNGAEKLLGNGDMLYAPIGMNKPERIQGSFINEKDVAALVDYCAKQAEPRFLQSAVEAAETAISDKKDGGGKRDRDEDGDELLYDAAMLIATTGQASVSFLQRRLAIGNPRAARLMDMLEQKGVVGGSKGAKPRDLLMSVDEIEELLG